MRDDITITVRQDEGEYVVTALVGAISYEGGGYSLAWALCDLAEQLEELGE
jgi:hypothetical protein